RAGDAGEARGRRHGSARFVTGTRGSSPRRAPRHAFPIGQHLAVERKWPHTPPTLHGTPVGASTSHGPVTFRRNARTLVLPTRMRGDPCPPPESPSSRASRGGLSPPGSPRDARDGPAPAAGAPRPPPPSPAAAPPPRRPYPVVPAPPWNRPPNAARRSPGPGRRRG